MERWRREERQWGFLRVAHAVGWMLLALLVVLSPVNVLSVPIFLGALVASGVYAVWGEYHLLRMWRHS
jgi:hypothetical protein